MFEFVYPENGETSIHNRLLDGPFSSKQDAVDKFTDRFSFDGFARLDKCGEKDVAAFLNNVTGVIVALRRVV